MPKKKKSPDSFSHKFTQEFGPDLKINKKGEQSKIRLVAPGKFNKY